ncbi:MAG: universal stress protein [Candidatus Sulfotelmatobacter sp.]
MCPVLTLGRRAPSDASPNGRVRQILCPSDLSPDSRAAAYAACLARQHGARLTIVHVGPDHPWTSTRKRRVDLIVLSVRASHCFAHPHGWPHAYRVRVRGFLSGDDVAVRQGIQVMMQTRWPQPVYGHRPQAD